MKTVLIIAVLAAVFGIEAPASAVNVGDGGSSVSDKGVTVVIVASGDGTATTVQVPDHDDGNESGHPLITYQALSADAANGSLSGWCLVEGRSPTDVTAFGYQYQIVGTLIG